LDRHRRAGCLGCSAKREHRTPEPWRRLYTSAIARLEDDARHWGRSDVTEVLDHACPGANADSFAHRTRRTGLRTTSHRRPPGLLARGAAAGRAARCAPAPSGMSAIERHGATRYTTEATLRSEARVLTRGKGEDARVGLVPERTLDMVLSGSILGADQQRAVRELLPVASRWPSSSVRRRGEVPLPSARHARPGTPAGYRPIGLRVGIAAARAVRPKRDLVPTPWPASPRCGERASQPLSLGT